MISKKSILLIMSILLSIASFLITFPPDYFIFSNIQAFALPFTLICFLFSIFNLFLRKYSIAFLPLLACLLTSSLFVGYLWEDYGNKKEVLSVANFNIWFENQNKMQAINHILKTDADIIGLEEVNTEWDSLLRKHLSKQYPYSFIIPINSNFFGIAVFSKYPFKTVGRKNWAGYPGIAGVVSTSLGELSFVVAHLAVPKEYYRYEIRKIQFLEMADYLNQSKNIKMAIGDFNTVSWAKEVLDFKENTNLIDSRKHISPTFPAKFPVIPIDHIFHSSELNCIDFEVKAIDSDHLGIVAHFAMN